MNNILIIVLNGFAGLVLGSFFYFGLYWTVKKGISAKHPGLLFSSSFFIRTLVVLAGVLFLTRGIFSRLIACMLGMVFSRVLVLILGKTFGKPNQVNP